MTAPEPEPRRPRRVRAAAIHLLISVCTAAAVALLLFSLWFPPPYASISGGLSLFALLMAVDVTLGPALTAVVASPGKPLRELRRDLAVIVAIQLLGFAYGLYTIALARPVHLVFEIDRFRVVTAADIETRLLPEAMPSLRTLPWTGPTLIAAAKPSRPDDQLRALDLGMAGIDLSMIPANWREYGSLCDEAWQKARPVSALLGRYPSAEAALKALAATEGLSVDALRFLPLQSRQASWVSVVAKPGARVVGHLPLDGFF